MASFLQSLAKLSPTELLFRWWFLFCFLCLISLSPPLEGLASAGGFALFVGYPYILILGLPPGIVRPSIRSAARWLLLGFGVVALVMAVAIPFLPEGYSTPHSPVSLREWIELAFGLVACLVVFTPFFLGAAALNDTRHHMRQSPTLESVPNFLALYFGPFGGWLHVHPRVREVLVPTNPQLGR